MSFAQLKTTYPDFYMHAKQIGYLIAKREAKIAAWEAGRRSKKAK